MPIYEYACKSCDHRLDALQKISDDVLRECPECGKLELKRLVSAPRFRLKGQGWYETDFKDGNQRNLAKGDSDKGNGDKGSGDKGSGDKKPKSGGDAAGKKPGDKATTAASGKSGNTNGSQSSAS